MVSRIWDRDISVWSAEPGLGRREVDRLPPRMARRRDHDGPAPRSVAALGQAAREEQVESVYLLGMGGSSLCAEVLRSVYGVAPGFPQLFVLDTTDERTLTTAAARMTPDAHVVRGREQERRHG